MAKKKQKPNYEGLVKHLKFYDRNCIPWGTQDLKRLAKKYHTPIPTLKNKSMIKRITRNVICDNCRKVITKTNYIEVDGKKRKLHYCNNERCSSHNAKAWEIFLKRENITYMRTALALTGITVSDVVADIIIRVNEGIHRKRGDFSLRDAVKIEHDVRNEYEKPIIVKGKKI